MENKGTPDFIVTKDNSNIIVVIECKAKTSDFIFNTIPAPVLTNTLLEQISPSALLLDLASAPGGFNLEKAKSMGKNAHLLLGLPGKYAPLSSAEKMMSFIFQHIKLSS